MSAQRYVQRLRSSAAYPAPSDVSAGTASRRRGMIIDTHQRVPPPPAVCAHNQAHAPLFNPPLLSFLYSSSRSRPADRAIGPGGRLFQIFLGCALQVLQRCVPGGRGKRRDQRKMQAVRRGSDRNRGRRPFHLALGRGTHKFLLYITYYFCWFVISLVWSVGFASPEEAGVCSIIHCGVRQVY